MFERFTDEARRTVVLASEAARERNDHMIEAVHMLIGLADEPAMVSTGLTRRRIESLWDDVIAATDRPDGIDSEALAGIGIDAAAVRYATDHSFGRGALGRARRRQLRPSTGHLPFSPTLKKALGLSLTHAVGSRSRDLTPTHLLLGLLDVDDADLLAVLLAAEVTIDGLRSSAEASLAVESTPTAPTSSPVRAGFDHVSLQVADLESAASFYGAALAPLGILELARHDDAVGFGSDRPFFWLGKATTDGPARELHLAFAAPDRRTVYAFRDAAVEAGAEVLNEPRIFREYHPSYFAAFVRDPDGNNVEAVCHIPAPA
jgi:catechol 2,3-dioxygenase-like lactoylglutathione lyase family enzyme